MLIVHDIGKYAVRCSDYIGCYCFDCYILDRDIIIGLFLSVLFHIVIIISHIVPDFITYTICWPNYFDI